MPEPPRPVPDPPPPPPAPDLAWLRRYVKLLDASVPLPGGVRIGLDGLLGLVPGWGDAAGLALSAAPILYAARLNVPVPVLLRMGLNLGIDALVGLVPILGDLFDFAWKANEKNLALLERALADAPRTRRRSTALLVATGVGLLALLSVPVMLSIWLIGWLWGLAFG